MFLWNDSAEVAFRTLKDKFTSALVLTIPDPKLQFIVEIEVSEVGIGAVFLQRSPKVALEEWRH